MNRDPGRQSTTRRACGQLVDQVLQIVAMAGMTTLRDRIQRLPTWPWPPQLLRGFVSALVLPLVIFVLTRLESTRFG
jgi:hypothetical protein